MKKLGFILLFALQFCFAQTTEKDLISASISNLFVSMKNSDSDGVRNSFAKTGILQTITKTGEVKSENIEDFAKSVANAEKGSLDERITFANIQMDGGLASVWTPYVFYYNGKFSHCGVNSFQMVKESVTWKIQYIIDTRRKESCVK